MKNSDERKQAAILQRAMMMWAPGKYGFTL